MTGDPLDELGGDLEELDRERRQQLVDLVAPFARINFQAGKIGFFAGGKLPPRQRIVVYLLARLALATKNPAHSQSVSPKEAEDELQIPGGTIRPKLAELVKAKVVFKGPDGGYSIRPSNISRAKDILSDVLPNNKAKGDSAFPSEFPQSKSE